MILALCFMECHTHQKILNRETRKLHGAALKKSVRHFLEQI